MELWNLRIHVKNYGIVNFKTLGIIGFICSKIFSEPFDLFTGFCCDVVHFLKLCLVYIPTLSFRLPCHNILSLHDFEYTYQRCKIYRAKIER